MEARLSWVMRPARERVGPHATVRPGSGLTLEFQGRWQDWLAETRCAFASLWAKLNYRCKGTNRSIEGPKRRLSAPAVIDALYVASSGSGALNIPNFLRAFAPLDHGFSM
jgi:hypothetical protein